MNTGNLDLRAYLSELEHLELEEERLKNERNELLKILKEKEKLIESLKEKNKAK